MGPGTADGTDEVPCNQTHVDMWQCIVNAQMAGPYVVSDHLIDIDDDGGFADTHADVAIALKYEHFTIATNLEKMMTMRLACRQLL